MPLSVDRRRQLEAEAGAFGLAKLAPANGVRLAINLYDLDRLLPFVRETLLGGKLDLKGGAIWVDRSRPDETAVAFACSLETAGAICDVIRSHDREAGDYPTRVYVFRRSWTKLPTDAVLTVMADGKCLTNPAVFGYNGLPRIDSPALAERLTVGRRIGGKSGTNGDGR